MVAVENVLPYNGVEGKGLQVRRMFDAIARRYDRLNHLLSLGFDKGWRHRAVCALKPYAPKNILDIASGTGDLALLLQKKLTANVIGADISDEMMAIGRKKAAQAGIEGVSFEWQDCMSLTYEDGRFDAVTSAFGIRNFEHLEQGLSEMFRVLKRGGVVSILELSTPQHFPMSLLYKMYSATVIPVVGAFMSLDKSAYSYLPASIKAMPQGGDMLEILKKQGFKNTKCQTFTGGICSLYMGEK